MHDDDSNNSLQTSGSPGSGKSAPKPNQRSGLAALLITLVFALPLGYLFAVLGRRPGGFQIDAMVAYTFAIPFFLSKGFEKRVPWALFNRFRWKFLLGHCLALAVVCGMATVEPAIKSHLPNWFTITDRYAIFFQGTYFDWCLAAIFLILISCECSWISRYGDKQAPAGQQS